MELRKIAAATLIIAAAFTGCKDDTGSFNDEFTISSDAVQFDGNTLTFGPERQTVTINVVTETATGRWTAICPTEDIWCTFSYQGGSLIVTVDANNTNSTRTTWIEIALGNNVRRIDVVQEYMRVLTFLSGETVNEGAARHAVSLPIQTNVAAGNLSVSVTDPPAIDWITDLAISATAVTFNILRNPSAVSTRSATIVAEGEGATAAITVVQNALSGYPYVIDLAAATFDDCYIYEIWDEVHNLKIGELCLEYLHKVPNGGDNPTVREQAKVAYPVSNGEVDLSNGLVVHNGNFVTWNTNVTSLTQPWDILSIYDDDGETVTGEITVIYLDEGAARMTTYDIDALPDDRINATLRPYILRDQRSGPANNHDQTEEDYSYKVVKIATQYWIAENLRTSRFRDGENIPTNITPNSAWVSSLGQGAPACAMSTPNNGATRYVDVNDESPGAVATRLEYGVLYTYNAIVNQVCVPGVAMTNLEDMLSPEGWHVPSRAQIEIMRNYVSQSTLNNDIYIYELDANGTGDFGNASGFGMKGNVQRGQSGGWNSNTHLATMDYVFDNNQSNDYNRHRYWCLRMEANSRFTNANNFLYGCRVANFVRCLRD